MIKSDFVFVQFIIIKTIYIKLLFFEEKEGESGR